MIFVPINIIFLCNSYICRSAASRFAVTKCDIIGYTKWWFIYEIQETFLAIHLKRGFKENKRHDLSQENSGFCIFDAREGHPAI